MTTGLLMHGCAGSTNPDSDVSAIRWTERCPGSPTVVAILLRIKQDDGSFRYESGLRGESGVPLIGAYGNDDDPTLFQTALRLIDAEKAEEIRLQWELHNDGCDGQLSVTRRNATLTISEALANEREPAFVRLDELIGRLTAEALKAKWT